MFLCIVVGQANGALVPNSYRPRVVGRHAGKQLFYHAQRSAREVTHRTSRQGREGKRGRESRQESGSFRHHKKESRKEGKGRLSATSRGLGIMLTRRLQLISPKSGYRPLGGLLLMKTTRFLAGWGAILDKQGENTSLKVPRKSCSLR